MKTAVDAMGSDYAPEEIVDSRTAAGVEGFIVLWAARAARVGKSLAVNGRLFAIRTSLAFSLLTYPSTSGSTFAGPQTTEEALV